ncbi:histidine phosphatase family protein [Maritalea sp.]|uniref:histidine phosphatase family protein n=1 Tax=Maritalea sp. TaxID=2003361 RepID=UPI003EF38A00
MSGDNWPLIYFIRHGQTDWNAAQRFQGQRDIPLNDFGREQAKGNGQILRDLLAKNGTDPLSLDWYCSPLDRTRETMDLVRSSFDDDLPAVTYDDRLKEISFGILEGVLLSDLAQKHPEELAARNKSKWDHLPPKGENYEMLLARLADFGAQLRRPSVVVAHGGVVRALKGFLANEIGPELDNWPAPQDKVMCFENGTFRQFG